MKRVVGWWMVSVVVLVTACMATVAQAQQPTVVLTVRGIEPLLNDAEFIGNEVDQEGIKEAAEAQIEAFTGGKGLAGIDQKKPLGAFWNATAGGPPEMPVLFIPVSDADALKGLLQELTPDFRDAKGDWSMTFNGTPVFGKVSGSYLFLSITPLSAKLPDPTKFVNSKYDLALDVSIASIPAELKSTFLEAMEASGRQALENGPPPASEAERVGRDLGFEGTLSTVKSVVNDGDKLTLGFDVDAKTRLSAVDFGITGKANSALAKAMTAYGKLQPLFAGIGSDSAPFRLAISYPTTGVIEQMEAFFKGIRETAEQEIDKDERLSDDNDRAAAKGLAKRLFDLMQGTVKSGSMHSGLVLEAGGEGKIRVIAATKVANGDDAGKLVDDIVKLSKENPELGKIKLDAAKHSGARIHEVTTDQSEDTEKYFGDEPAHLGFRADSLWMSIGGDNLTALKKALDQTAKPATRATASPISFQVKPAALVLLMEKDDEGLIERAKTIVGKPGDKLILDIAPVTNGAKLRLEMGIDLLKLADQEKDEDDSK